jgi:phosphoribosylformylglycinamidine synthase
MFRLRGSAAQPEFRIRKLESVLREVLPALESVSAEFWHFVEFEKDPAPEKGDVLRQLLDYGVREPVDHTGGVLFVVVPRFGTISPWSTKATDIAHHCGLHEVKRVERGVAWRLQLPGDRFTAAVDSAAIIEHIHDPMTESVVTDFDRCEDLFQHFEPRPLQVVDVLSGGVPALARANQKWGMALSEDEILYLVEQFSGMRRNPTDVELMMFAQANSEHCRHKIFNANWIIDHEHRDQTLFNMIRESHRRNGDGTLVAYKDNAAVLRGSRAERLFPRSGTLDYEYHDESIHIVCKVETHNHPTGISPFPGAATGSGGEIRDEGATGIGAKPKAGLTGFTVSNLRIPGAIRPWERPESKPTRLASPLQIMLEGPIGGASFNNEFGRPNIAGYFRTYEQETVDASGDLEIRGYHKPIMLAGGLGNIREAHVQKRDIPDGAVIVVLGGPAMMIGLGGGAASSVATGTGDEALDFSSVQRGNPEMQRRCQEVIDRCWEMGDANPILSIHDVGAGGLSNALPELVEGSGRGADFQLRKILNDDPGMTPMQIWCNEAQERYTLAVDANRLNEFVGLCERERCLYCVVGRATDDRTLQLGDAHFRGRGVPWSTPIDLPMQTLFGNAPVMTRDVRTSPGSQAKLQFAGTDIAEALDRVLLMPSVADKTFLVSIGDRSVGGLVCRDQMVGPWQVPVSDVAVTVAGFTTFHGEAMAIGERTPLAVVDAPASGRMAVAEALLNLAAADIRSLSEVKLSANWMVASGHPGEDAALFETVRAVAVDLCPALGISIPVGKDSMSMKSVWSDARGEHQVTSPLSLIVSAFAPVDDVRKTSTPVAVASDGAEFWLIDLGEGRNRLGGSALAQAYGQMGDAVPDVDDPGLLRNAFLAIQEMVSRGLIVAYHDRSDGGVIVTLLEMSFAGRIGLDVDLCGLVGEGDEKDILRVLFNEEPGAIIQVLPEHLMEVSNVLESHGLGDAAYRIATPRADNRIHILDGERILLDTARTKLHRTWSETTWRLQALRDNENCANAEYDRILDTEDSGLFTSLTYDPSASATPTILGVQPKVAILREQGVNGHVEMAAAFKRAGFEAADVTMHDLLTGRHRLSRFQGLAACGGFSFGDVLGAGGGWARSILFNDLLRQQFLEFFDREEAFTLGVCNGCQMLAGLKELIPGAAHWPRFVRNLSEQFEARFVMVEVAPSPSVLLSGMHGSRLPVVVSHGEGRIESEAEAELDCLRDSIALRFTDNRGAETETYPYNPNGSAMGITGLSNENGRVTIMMPHPERVFRTVQCSWAPEDWGEDSGWMRLFRNAREFV